MNPRNVTTGDLVCSPKPKCTNKRKRIHITEGSKGLSLLILLHLGIQVNLSETENSCQEDTWLWGHILCHFVWRHRNTSRYSLPVPGWALITNGFPQVAPTHARVGESGRAVSHGCTSGVQPCRANKSAGLHDHPDLQLWTVTAHV